MHKSIWPPTRDEAEQAKEKAKRDITEAKGKADKAKAEAETLKYKAEIHIREAREETKRAQSEAFKSQFEYRESKDKLACQKCKYVFKNRHHLSDHKLLNCNNSTRESIGKKEVNCLNCDLPVTSSEFVEHTKVKVACKWSSLVLT